MGSSASSGLAQEARAAHNQLSQPSASTPRLPSSARRDFQEVQLAPKEEHRDSVAAASSGSSRPPDVVPSSSAGPSNQPRPQLQRENTCGLSSAQPTYESDEGMVLETFYHQNNQLSFRCVYRDGQRFYYDKKREEWIPFPKKWFSCGLLVTDKTCCTKDDVLEAAGQRRSRNGEVDVGEVSDDRVGSIYHPEKGRLSTYIMQEKMNVHVYFDKEQGIWVRLPLAWELHSDFVKKLLADIHETVPDWKDRYDMLSALRACNYDPNMCISTYFAWGDTSSLAGARNPQDAKVLEDKNKHIDELQKQLKATQEKLDKTVGELEAEQTSRIQAESISEQMKDKMSGMEAEMSSMSAMLVSLQSRPKTPLIQQKQQPPIDNSLVRTMKQSAQSLHKQHARLRMDVTNAFAYFTKTLVDVSRGVKDIGNCDSGVAEELAEMRELYRREALQRKLLYNQLQDLRGNIRVFCRCRYDNRTKCCLQFPSETEITPPGTKKPFRFNRVFTPKSTQEEVYEDTKPLVTSCVDGYNVCILAYGQTGSGKTFTMQGPTSEPGVNVRALADLLDICKGRENIQYTLTASMVEIYNETIQDLLNNKLTTLEIRAQGSKIVLPGITELKVQTVEDINEIISLGQKNRSVASTKMNSESSRSHLIFMITVKGLDKASGAISVGTLTLCDLAGSERVGKSEATGQRLTEAAAINKSLSALGQVFTALKLSQLHIPYRNSKLTHILQPSLGGDAKACLFIMLSPDENNLSETMSTLQFGNNAQQVELGQAKKKKVPTATLR